MPEYELSYSDFKLSINFVTAAAIVEDLTSGFHPAAVVRSFLRQHFRQLPLGLLRRDFWIVEVVGDDIDP